MAIVEELIREELDGGIGFGNYTLLQKAKVEDFKHAGDLYKVKTFQTMTKLEKNGMFLYESVPGTSVTNFVETENGVTFVVESGADAQLTIGLESDTEYEVFVKGQSIGKIKSNISGKINISLELADAGEVPVEIRK
ncbi:MAG: endosialidase [Lachnospiraceae bacterium]|nr:endosialidase [Lachnospiraceae bacterium]